MPLGVIVANFLNSYTEPGPVAWWVKDPVAFTKAPVAYDPIESDETAPWN